jgi:hypothetical protein
MALRTRVARLEAQQGARPWCPHLAPRVTFGEVDRAGQPAERACPCGRERLMIAVEYFADGERKGAE